MEPLEHAFRVVAERLNHLSDLAPQFLEGGEATERNLQGTNKSFIQGMFEDGFSFFKVGYVSSVEGRFLV